MNPSVYLKKLVLIYSNHFLLSTGVEGALHNFLQKILAPISHNVPAV
jgi:hypothetical protein